MWTRMVHERVLNECRWDYSHKPQWNELLTHVLFRSFTSIPREGELLIVIHSKYLWTWFVLSTWNCVDSIDASGSWEQHKLKNFKKGRPLQGKWKYEVQCWIWVQRSKRSGKPLYVYFNPHPLLINKCTVWPPHPFLPLSENIYYWTHKPSMVFILALIVSQQQQSRSNQRKPHPVIHLHLRGHFAEQFMPP